MSTWPRIYNFQTPEYLPKKAIIMAKVRVSSKSLLGAMAFLTLFLLIVLSTFVFVLIQSLNRNVATTTGHSTEVRTKQNQMIATRTKLSKQQRALNKLKWICKMSGKRLARLKLNPEYLQQFKRIEEGKGIRQVLQVMPMPYPECNVKILSISKSSWHHSASRLAPRLSKQ